MKLTPCPRNPSQLAYLRWGVKRAKECGLPQEFSEWYRRYREDGCDVYECVWFALNDWDMLDP